MGAGAEMGGGASRDLTRGSAERVHHCSILDSELSANLSSTHINNSS